MDLGGNLLDAVATVIHYLLTFYMYIIIARAIISWVSPNPYNPIVNFLYMATEPVLSYVRKIIPPIGGSVDISPIIVLVAIVFLDRILIQSLHQLANSF